MATRGVSFLFTSRKLYVQDTRNFTFGGRAAMPALRERGRGAFPSAGRAGMESPDPFAFAAVPLPPVQRAAPGFFLPPAAGKERGNRGRRITGKNRRLRRLRQTQARGWALS